MSFQFAPASALSCHCTDGAGLLSAAAEKLAWPPATADWLDGLVVTSGMVFTVRVAGLEMALPAMFVSTARNRLPFWMAVAEKL